ncbi:hypothetical protein GVAV_001677 [Gurleya vavrai]
MSKQNKNSQLNFNFTNSNDIINNDILNFDPLQSENYNFLNSSVSTKHSKKEFSKPWMNYVDKYSLLSNKQKEALDMYFISNQVKLSRKNLRHISKELKISYKKIINYVYERDYDHLIVKEDFVDENIADLKKN